jgi:cellulose synthase/poly-beta-1,6-N-acetylglucosamine synthase-like glycosyltransferase
MVWIGAAAFVVYILLGYPYLLSKQHGRRRPAVAKDLRHRPPVTIVMVVYNGAAYLERKLETLLGLDYEPEKRRILVVSDGSTDATNAIAARYAGRGVELLVCPHAGKAAGLNAAFAHAAFSGDREELVFFTDVRQPLDRMALAHLAANFADATVGAATGEMRLLEGTAGEQQDMGLYWRYEIWARSRQTEIDSLFNTTGCIYGMRRSLVGPLPADTLSDDAVLPLRAFFAGYRVIFDPAALAYDYPAVAGTEFRRRWRNLAGLWQVHARTPALFTSRNRMRWHFLAHKFGRLVLPWALLAMALSVFWLPVAMGVRAALLAAMLLGIGLAIVEPWLPRSLKRVASPLRTFLVMNAASAVSVSVFFMSAQKLWRPTVAGGETKA